MTTLKKPLNFDELVNQGTVIEVHQPENFTHSEDEEEDAEYQEALANFTNLNVVGQFDNEETFDDKEPFEIIASKMTKLLDNGNILKRVLRKGYGEPLEEKTLVRVHYNGYLEYNAEPFDSTYARNKPVQFSVGVGEILPGIDISVQSMLLNEKSQFLVKPDLAYGKMGCLQRVPANSTVLFEIELLEVIESNAAENFQYLPPEQQRNFTEVYKYSLSLCAKGKDMFTRNIRSAIKEYNTATNALENAQLESYEDQIKQQELLLKLYSNLLVCYTKEEQPKKGCFNFNKIEHMCKGSSMKIPSKVYYNNAKCLRMLGEFERAKNQLKKAYELEPRNKQILEEIKRIDEEQKRYLEEQKKLSKAFVSLQ